MLFSPFGKKSHIFARAGLTLALVINLTLPAFASDLTTGSAFAVDERLLTSARLTAASASAPVGSSTDPYYVRPFTNGSATVYKYSWSTSNPNGSSSGSNQSFTNFADIVTHITSSIANSFLALGQRLHYDNDAIYSRLADILTAIQNSSTDVVKIADNSDNNFSQDYLWKKYLTATSGSLPRLSSGGVYSTQSVNFSNMSVLGAIEAMLYYTATGATNGISLLVRDVRDNNAALDDYLYDSQLNAALIPRTTVWQNMRDFWSNTSDHLAHLRYVLANDDDIALRQSQHDNMATVTSDFTSGDVSVSPAKLGGLKSVGSALTDGLSSSASVSDGLSVLGSESDAWSWFSEENALSFDSVSNRSLMRLQRGVSHSYLDLYYKDVLPYVN